MVIFYAESYYLESFTSKIPLSSLRNISKNEEDDFDQRERDGLSEFSEICSLIHTEWNLIQAPGSLPAWKQTKRLKKQREEVKKIPLKSFEDGLQLFEKLSKKQSTPQYKKTWPAGNGTITKVYCVLASRLNNQYESFDILIYETFVSELTLL